MKKVLVVLGLCAIITACGGGSKSGSTGGADSTGAANQTAKQAEPNADTNATKIGTEKDAGAVVMPGAKLMAASDCNTCHKVNEKVIGPALADVAAKYPPTASNIDMLTQKVIKEAAAIGEIAMAPHPTLPAADVKQMVEYVLSLKK